MGVEFYFLFSPLNKWILKLFRTALESISVSLRALNLIYFNLIQIMFWDRKSMIRKVKANEEWKK